MKSQDWNIDDINQTAVWITRLKMIEGQKVDSFAFNLSAIISWVFLLHKVQSALLSEVKITIFFFFFISLYCNPWYLKMFSTYYY